MIRITSKIKRIIELRPIEEKNYFKKLEAALKLLIIEIMITINNIQIITKGSKLSFIFKEVKFVII